MDYCEIRNDRPPKKLAGFSDRIRPVRPNDGKQKERHFRRYMEPYASAADLEVLTSETLTDADHRH